MSRARPTARGPGIFYFNAYDLPSRTTPGMTTLYLHEGAPGHHFQISLAQENEALPPFMRFGGNTALCRGLGALCRDARLRHGLLQGPLSSASARCRDEMLRAMRLVVDTGIHSKGWTREQAIDYMLGHSDMGKTDATAEVERYIAIPSQALAYKIGALTIQRLRAQGRGRAWAQVRHPRIPRPGADDRRAAAGRSSSRRSTAGSRTKGELGLAFGRGAAQSFVMTGKDRQAAMAEFRGIMKWILGIAVVMVAGALVYLKATGDLNLHMVVATIGGVFFSVLLGCGLFAAAFFSDKSGHDQSISDATKSQREE